MTITLHQHVERPGPPTPLSGGIVWALVLASINRPLTETAYAFWDEPVYFECLESFCLLHLRCCAGSVSTPSPDHQDAYNVILGSRGYHSYCFG